MNDPIAAAEQAKLDATLLKAVWLGHSRIAADLLAKGASPFAKRHGMSALEMAASKNKPACVKILLAAGALAESPERKGKGNLLSDYMAWMGPECVELLIGAGASPLSRDHQGRTPLMLACFKGSRKVVAALLKDKRVKKLAHLNAVDKEGRGALMHAIHWSDGALVEDLLDAGCAMDSAKHPHAPYGGSALSFAALREQDLSLPMMSALLNRGANPNAIDARGKGPLYVAARALAAVPDQMALATQKITLLTERGAKIKSTGPGSLRQMANDGYPHMASLVRDIATSVRERASLQAATRGPATDNPPPRRARL